MDSESEEAEDMRVEANRFHTLRRLKTGQGGDYFPEESCHMFAAKGLHVNRDKELACAFCNFTISNLDSKVPNEKDLFSDHFEWQKMNGESCSFLTGRGDEINQRNVADMTNDFNWSNHLVTAKSRENNSSSQEPVVTRNTPEVIEKLLECWDYPIIERALQAGLKPAEVRKYLFRQIKSGKPIAKHVSEILTAVLSKHSEVENPASVEAARHQEEVARCQKEADFRACREIKECLLCKICKHAVVEMAYLPCTHMARTKASYDEDVIFRCHGDYELTENIVGRNESITTIIYVPAGNEIDNSSFNVTCLLVNTKDMSTEAEDLEFSSLHITNVAHTLLFRISNSTWHKTLIIPPQDEEGVWRRSIDISEFSMLGGASGSNLLEEFLFTVELDNGLHTSYGSLMIYGRQPLTHWMLGSKVTMPMSDVLSGRSVSGLLSKVLPCSGSIWVTSPVMVGDVYLGVTFRSFTERELMWYRLTDSLLQACSKVTGTETDCDMSSVTLKELILTNYHIFLVTNLGFFVSSEMHLSNENMATKPQIDWIMVDPFRSYVNRSDVPNNVLADYTPICLDKQSSCIHKDEIYMTYHMQDQPGVICIGSKNFSESHWNCQLSQSPEPAGEIIQIIPTIHSEYVIILQWNETTVQAAVTISLPSLNVAIFPTYYLPANLRFTRMKLHPQALVVFLFGEELWASYDTGATFYAMYRSELRHPVKDVIFNADNVNTELLAVAGEENGGYTDLVYGTLESQRMMHVTTTQAIASPFLLINNPKHIQIYKLENDEFELESINNIEDVLSQKVYLDVSLALEFSSSTEYTVYELTQQLSGSHTRLAFYHVGMVLVGQRGGQAKIVDFRTTKHGAQVTLAINVPFHTDTERANMLPFDIKIDKVGDRDVHITLQRNGATVTSDGWLSSDVNKTLIVALHTDYLITEVLNTSTVAAVAVDDFKADLISQGHWKIVDMSAGTWWLEEDKCRQRVKVKSASHHRLIAIDIGTSTSLHIETSNEFSNSLRFSNPKIDYSNPYIFTKSSEVDRYPGHIITHLTLTDRYFKSSGSSVLIYYAHSSLLCTSTAHIYRVLLCCSFHKRIIFTYPQKLTPQMLLDYNRHGDILKDLPVNYRPPSALGIAIPLSHNIYNADPSKPLLYSKYKKSMETAVFKLTPSCYQKSSPCGCTPDKEASRLVTHSDCIKRVYKLTLPGWLYLCFAFEVLNTTSNRIYLSPIDSMYNLTLKELNGRKDFQLYRQESARSKADTISQKSADLEGFAYSTAPYNLRIKMMGSGLYHFRSAVPPIMSYCTLQTEFVVYIDEPPVPYPLLFLMNFGVAIGMGFVIFLIYAAYRLNNDYSLYIQETLHMPACIHTPTEFNHITTKPSDAALLNHYNSPLNSPGVRRRTNALV